MTDLQRKAEPVIVRLPQIDVANAESLMTSSARPALLVSRLWRT